MWWKFVFMIPCIQLMFCEIITPPAEDWWQNSIVYEIFPLSFKDSDGDGFGDFKGITQKLDYLADLGVNAIWLTPFFESPLESGGYDITNYTEVQKVFGTMEDLKELINTAHKKNIKFIMDLVPNHTSNKHEWFKRSIDRSPEYTNYYIWSDAKNQKDVMKNDSVIPIEPNNWKNIVDSGKNSSAWFWHNTRKQFYFSQFIDNLPDLNFREEKVKTEMKNVINYWLEMGVDGIRIDALRHVYENKSMEDEPPIDVITRPGIYHSFNHIYTIDQVEVYDLIKEWRLILDKATQKSGKTRIIMTESYSPTNVLFKYYTSGAQIPTNFQFLDGIDPWEIPVKNYEQIIKDWITKMPLGAVYNIVFQNHDHRRMLSRLIDGMNALSLFLPGVAIVFYGGEIGMQDISDQINYSRSPMQWDDSKHAGFTNNSSGPWVEVHSEYMTTNVETEKNNPKSHLNIFKSVAKLRQTNTLKRGGLATYVFNETVFVLNRFLPNNENYTLVFNMGTSSQHVCLSDQMPNLIEHLFIVVSNSNDSRKTIHTSESLILSPGETLILTDNMDHPLTVKSSSSSTQLYNTLIIVLLLCLYQCRI